jgi:hypothetical protein
MSAVQIKWPKPNHHRMKTGVHVASGRADSSIIGVFGECRPASGTGPVIIGRTFAYYLSGAAHSPRHYRWMIALRVPDSGDYELTVTGLTAAGDAARDRTTFTVRGAHFLGITHPQTDDDITAEADDFVAYGDLSEVPLGIVSMEDSQQNVILPVHTFGDYTDLLFWSAQFPTLAAETYALHAEDANGVGGTSSNLTVT